MTASTSGQYPHMFTPNTAAKHVGTSRSAIMRALASKSLPATRDNQNRWQISQTALEAWAADRPDSPDTIRPMAEDSIRPVVADSAELAEVRTKIAALTAENAGLRHRLDDTQKERDRLASMLEKALEARSVQPVASAPTRSAGLWARLLGRGA